ncbi:MAG: hypothetical protein VX642_15280 [Bdellovibrionota bacterium]|nr:hypothetical protein [Bdellovibrionota bacterium]
MQGLQAIAIAIMLTVSSSLFACKIKGPIVGKEDFKCLQEKVAELYEIPKKGKNGVSSLKVIAGNEEVKTGLKVIQ